MSGEAKHWLMQVLLVDDWFGVGLAVFGIIAQGLFMCRMLVQWIVSEKARRSIVPLVTPLARKASNSDAKAKPASP